MSSVLVDITHLIVPDEDITYFTVEESLELYQTCLHLMEEFIKDNYDIISEQDFDDMFDENIYELMNSHFENDIFHNEDAQEELEEIIEHAKKDFFTYVIHPRSYNDTIILQEPDIDTLNKQIIKIRNKPQPPQRTPEWYEFRHNLITASNAYKAFDSQSAQNQLIYEKCLPLNPKFDDNNGDNDVKIIQDVVMVNTNTPLHWGQKYEPLSVKIYEQTYYTKIEDFGCIQHDIYKFLGASPDGINIDKTSKRYGRMLEIKNIVNRKIDGIPKKEYWIQMQLQMEVCDLNECDFLETKFIEYTDIESYKEDTTDELYEDEDGNEFNNICLSKDNKLKGSIIYFHTKEGKPFYAYRPIELIHPDDIDKWHDNTLEYYENNPEFKYTFMKTIYWKLEQFSCVLVCRNKQWFNDNICHLKHIWDIIEKERISGHEHRAPNRKQKKEVPIMTPTSNGCLLHFTPVLI
jgi:putative phage-type endonuclease